MIRTALKDLIPQLDAAQFAQVHRSVVVNLSAISHVTRGENETAEIHLKGRQETLPVSRTLSAFVPADVSCRGLALGARATPPGARRDRGGGLGK